MLACLLTYFASPYLADKLVIEEVQVKRNDSSIEWDKKLSDKKSKEFKEMALAVKKQLKEDLKDLQGINEIRVKKFTKKDGDVFCNFECKVNTKQVNKEDIKDTLNMTVDIGATAEISYTRINMSLNLSSLSWIDAYNDHNSSEYKNLTTAIIAALSEVYQDTEEVLGFEIVSISEAHDGSLVVDYHVLVDSESNLKKNDLEETIKESTKDGSFGKMFTGVKKQQEQQQQTGSEEDKLVIEEVQVKRNDSSIEWDKKLSDKKSKEFKEMALAVKKQLKEDLKDLQGINEIRVKKFTKKDGDIFCNFECKVNTKLVNKEDIKDTLNMTVDIGATAEISYTRINMSLNLSSLSWIDAYNDHNSSEYKNLTTAIIAALSEVYQDTEEVLGFEIVSISEAHDGSLVVDYHVLVDSESNLKKNDLEETIKESTKDGSFGKMFTGVKKQQEQQQQTGSEEDKLVIEEVQVKRNDSSIEWDKKLSDKKSKEFKEMALAVKKQLKEDLKDLQGINEIRVKKFTKKDGDIFCNFECKVNTKLVNKEDIKYTLNMTVDIGATAEISYTRINMSLNLSSLSWIDAYNDHNSSEYKNLTTAIIAALSEVYQDTEEVLGFEIVSISEAHDGSNSLVVDYHVLVDSESNLKKNDLEETIKESTKDSSFGKMFTGVKKQQEQQQQTGSEEEDDKDKPPVGLIVFAAVIICLVILTFLVMVSTYL